jgi:hypothetical protein
VSPTDDELLDTFLSDVTGQFVDDARADAVRSGSADAGAKSPADAGATPETVAAAKAAIESPMYGPAVSSQLPLAFAADQPLQKLLDDAIAKNKSYVPLGIALVDLTDGPDGRYAQHQGDTSFALDSIAKIAPMYAAYQLRHDLVAFAKVAAPADAAALTSGFQNLLKAASEPAVRAVARKPPKFDAIFELDVPALAKGFGFQSSFASTLMGGDLRAMIQQSDDGAASRCIAYLGFEWINAVLQQSGLASMSAAGPPNGFYLGMLYAGVSAEQDPYVKNYPYSWPDHRTDRRQYGSAKAVAQLLALIATSRLVDAPSSGEMRVLMYDQGLSYFNHGLVALLGSRAPILPAKVGYVRKKGAGDCAIVDRQTTDRHRIRYVAVGVGAKYESDNTNAVLESLIKDLDAAVVARNGFKD